jgi:hypothetical protein
MGFLKDMRSMQKTAKDMTPPEHRGVMGGFRAMKDLASTGAAVMGDMQTQNANGQRLMATGRQGTATVTAIRDTGLTVNENPQVELDLQVAVDGAAPYAVTHRQVVSRVAIPAFQPGATVPVRVDPADPQTLLIA